MAPALQVVSEPTSRVMTDDIASQGLAIEFSDFEPHGLTEFGTAASILS